MRWYSALMTTRRIREAARELSKLGASKGGKARAANLTPERRAEIARGAVQARWARAERIGLSRERPL